MDEDEGAFAGEHRAPAAEGNAAVDAVAATESERALPLLGALEALEAVLEVGVALVVEQIDDGAAHQGFGAVAEGFRGESVERGEAALHGAGEDESERILDDFAVAGLTGMEGLFDLALLCDVLAGEDEVLDLVVVALELSLIHI